MEYDAIISVDEAGFANIIKMLTQESWKIRAQIEDNEIVEHHFDVMPGLYYANCSGRYCGGSVCINPDCANDCFEVVWEIQKPLYIIDSSKDL